MSTVVDSPRWIKTGFSDRSVNTGDGGLNPSLTGMEAARADEWLPFLANLQAWSKDTALCDDGESEPVPPSVFAKALRVGEAMMTRGYAAPTFVLPLPDGQLAFERRDGNVTETIYFAADQVPQYVGIQDLKIFLKLAFQEA